MARPTSETTAAPPAVSMALVYGFMPSMVLHVAAELGIADRLAEGAKSAETLARETRTDAPSLHRLLRALASLGVADEIEPGRFVLTSLGSHLRTGTPGSLRNLARLSGAERSWRCWGDLLHSVRTGESGMRRLYGMGGFDLLATEPEAAVIFNEAMGEATTQVARAVVAAYDFSRFCTFVDVGGGNGTLAAAILAGAPKLRGIVFDLPTGNAQAPQLLAAEGVAQRCEVVAGDFFRFVPDGADAYVLKSIIHDWDDEQSIAILKNCRKAMTPGGQLLLVERVMPERMEASASHREMAMMDMNMLTLPGGRERTEAECRALLEAAGFALESILPLPDIADRAIVEATPR